MTTPHRSRLLAWLTIAAAVVVSGFSCSGYLMVGSFSVAQPERLASYQQSAWIYIAMRAASAVAALIAALFLARLGSRTRDESLPHT
jgi:hypothetical protein